MLPLYYLPRSPITSIRIEQNLAHLAITFWLNHANSGTLIVAQFEARSFLQLLIDPSTQDPVWFEACNDTFILHNPDLDDTVLSGEVILITSNGEYSTVCEVVALAKKWKS
jgi:hypothetical protein